MSQMTHVPLVDLRRQYESIKREVDRAIARVISNSSFILGKEVEAFEREFAEFSGFRHVIGVANGTDALHLALRAHELAAGEEVVAPTHTFVATTEAVTLAGGRLQLADVSDQTFCMTEASLDSAMTSATRAVIAVPIYGNPAELESAVEIAQRRGAVVIADCAQAHGATVDGKKLGGIVQTACFSFYPGKNLGAYGDAGAVATNDDHVARLARMWRNHGREGKFDHEFEAVNSRLDGLQAAILRAKLPHLEEWTNKRRLVAAMYRERLSGVRGVRLPDETERARHVYHLFVVRVHERDRVRAKLRELGVGAGVHYPAPIHLLPAYKHLGLGRGSFPVAERICETVLSLPMFPEMGEGEVDHVVGALRQAV